MNITRTFNKIGGRVKEIAREIESFFGSIVKC